MAHYPEYVALSPWGQVVKVKGLTIDGQPLSDFYHRKEACEGQHCPFHNPSDHHMRDWAMTLRLDRSGLIERRCQHGTSHPDPDSVAFLESSRGETHWSVHGCDGCCKGPNRLSDEEIERHATKDADHCPWCGRRYIADDKLCLHSEETVEKPSRN